ncbi:MAG: hypothetical protein ABIG96_06515 [Candidatus Micrarchaeota archaeon]
MASFLATDLATSVFLSTISFVCLLSAFFLLSADLASQSSIILAEQKALLISDHLLHSCKEGVGLSFCDSSGAHNNVLSASSVHEFSFVNLTYFSEYFGISGRKLGIAIMREGRQLFSFGDRLSGGICINRPVILEGKSAILRICLI